MKRANGVPPGLDVTMAAKSESDAIEITAQARVVEKSAPVYYTLGADTEGVYHNAKVAWELYGPRDEDYLFLRPDNLKPRVREIAGADRDRSNSAAKPARQLPPPCIDRGYSGPHHGRLAAF